MTPKPKLLAAHDAAITYIRTQLERLHTHDAWHAGQIAVARRLYSMRERT
jgi:hypothetical protein